MAIPLNDGNLDEIVTAFQDAGIVILSDVDPGPLDMLTRMLSERSGLTPEQIQSAGHDGNVDITPEMRQRLTRGFMTPELMSTLYDTFGDLVVRLIGPIVHASQDFHYQVKRKSESGVILKGRSSDSKEVQALYGIHNELTAARVVTTPSAMVCWVPLNDYDGTAIYFYPGTHRVGLLTSRWLPRHQDLEDVDKWGPVVEYRPQRGEVVLFHFLLMHGSGAPSDAGDFDGPHDPVRISCDLRFFPFCGVLDSSATCLRPDPVEWIRARVSEVSDDLLLAPLFETLAYLGLPIDWPELPELSSAYWAQFIEGLVGGDEAQRIEAISRLVNTEIGYDPVEAYHERFRAAQLCEQPYRSIRDSVPEAGPLLHALAG